MEQVKQKVAFLLDDGFDDAKMKELYEGFTTNGAEAVMISLDKDRVLIGKDGTNKYTPQLTVEEAKPEDYDVVVILLNDSAESTLHSEEVQKFIEAANKNKVEILSRYHVNYAEEQYAPGSSVES